MQTAAHSGQTVQNTAQTDINREADKQKRPSQKKTIPKIAVILPVCIVIIGVIAFVALNLKDNTATDKNVASEGHSPSADNINSSQTTPFTEYVSLVGGDYTELYSDEYDVIRNGEDGYYYTATTDISFMDMSGTGSFGFFYTEDKDTQSSLEESGIENDTVLGFQWTCDASVYSLDDVSASFESIYGASPMHSTYSISGQDTEPQVESYYWENVEGGYDLELYLPSDGTMITASWSVHPAVEGSYEDIVSALERALEERDVTAYESLLYEDDKTLSASDSTKEEMADIISNEEIDQIDCYIGEAIKVNTYVSSYMMSGNYSISSSDLERIESLYFVNVDFILYQNENIVTGASCKMDIASIDGEWKILGMFQKERFSDTLLVEFAKQYYEFVNGDVPPNVEVDHYEGDNVVIHLYEVNGNAISTWDWYTINPYTCEGTDFLGNEVQLYGFFNGAGQ